ncbi:MAG: LysR family transcriptional regulator [Parvibaculaceae bacterium]
MRFSVGTLKTFITVAEMGSITEAGDKLGRTPSTISMTLKALEADIGAPLFETDRKNRLSKAGTFVLAQARELLSHHERSVAAIKAFAGNQAGRVDLACVPSVATSVVPGVLLRFRQSHPGVEINVRDADSPSVAEAVESGKVALGVASLRRSRPDLHFEALFEENLGIICRADDPLASAAAPVAWADLHDRTFLGNGISSMIEAPEFASLMSGAPIVVYNVLSLLALVRAGVGITVLPRLSIAAANEGLAFVPLRDRSARRTVGLITRSIERYSPAEAAFVRQLRLTLQEKAAGLGIRMIDEKSVRST